MEERLAVIKDFNIGVGDRGVPAIWFSAYVNEVAAALQVIQGAEAIHEFIAATNLSDVTKIEGRTCWVDEGDGLIRYKRLAFSK